MKPSDHLCFLRNRLGDFFQQKYREFNRTIKKEIFFMVQDFSFLPANNGNNEPGEIDHVLQINLFVG